MHKVRECRNRKIIDQADDKEQTKRAKTTDRAINKRIY